MDIAIGFKWMPADQNWQLVDSHGEWRMFIQSGTGRDGLVHHGNGFVSVMLGNVGVQPTLDKWVEEGASISKLSDHIGNFICGCIFTKDRIVIFKDKLGTIPLVYFEEKGSLIFTTSPTLLTSLTRQRSLNRRWLVHYLACENTDSREDVFEGVTRLRAGECFVWKDACGQVESYWPKADFFKPISGLSLKECVELFRDEMVRAVARIPTDKPRVYSMSGGLDSCGIVGITHHLQAPGSEPLRVYSMRSQQFSGADESKQICAMQQAFQLDAHSVDLEKATFYAVPQMYAFDAFGPQFTNSSDLMATLLFAASECPGCQIITGFGGNYLVATSPETVWLDLFQRRDLSGIAHTLMHSSYNVYRSTFRHVMANVYGGKIRAWGKEKLPKCVRQRIFANSDLIDSLGCWRRVNPLLGAHKIPDFGLNLSELRLFNVRSWCHEFWARSLDKAMRLTGISVYDPLFDSDLYTMSARLPCRMWQDGMLYRPGYKEAMSAFLPACVTNHLKCKSFNDVVDEGFVRKAHAQVVSAIRSIQSNPELSAFIDGDALLRAYELYCTKNTRHEPVSYSARYALWRAISMAL